MLGRIAPIVVVVPWCASASAQVTFAERSADAGCPHTHLMVQYTTGLEFQAAGGAVGDFNRDGHQDLFVLGGSGGFDRLFMNDGQGNFNDTSLAAGVSRSHRGTGVAVADYNGDGWLDVYVTSLGPPSGQMPGSNILYRNNGDGTFTDVTQAAGVRFNNFQIADAYGASFGDYDRDGDLDLAVAGWLGGNRLFRNNGDGTFTDRTAFSLPLDMGTVRGYSPRFVDMDDDGYPELLWAADFITSRYLVNNGNGTFSNFTAGSGTGLDSNGMGSAVGDFNNDGRLDWYVTSRINKDQTAGSGNMLYLQTATPHVFTEESVASGVNMGFWGWGTDAVDFDHNGHLDLVATNGWSGGLAETPTRLFMSNGDGTFADRATEAGVATPSQGRGLLTADFDADGLRDLVVFNNHQPMMLYRNQGGPGVGQSIALFFDTRKDPALPPDGFGTSVTLTTAGPVATQRRMIDGGTNYLAQSELSAHFGLAGAAAGTVTVRYADGTTDTFPNVGPGRYTIERLVCPADFRQDGVLNFFDISDFLGRYNARHPMADFNRDGLFNFFDVAGFIASYNAGCP